MGSLKGSQLGPAFAKACSVAHLGTDVAFRITPVSHNFLQLVYGRSQWPRCIRRGSEAARFLGLWVRIPPGAWVPVCCEYSVLSGRSLYDWPIHRLEETYHVCMCVCVCVCVCVIDYAEVHIQLQRLDRIVWPRSKKVGYVQKAVFFSCNAAEVAVNDSAVSTAGS